MTPVLPSTAALPPTAAAKSSPVRRAAAKDDGGTEFGDLLPDHQAKGAEVDGDTSPVVPTHGKPERRIGEEAVATGASLPGGVPSPGQMIPAASAQQALLVAHAVPVGGTDPAVSDGSANGGVTDSDALPDPTLDPGKPPLAVSAKVPLIAPHGPPVILDDGTGQNDPAATDGEKIPAIAPHGPPTQSLDEPTADVNDKPPVIRPHGSVELAPTSQEEAIGVDVSSPAAPTVTAAASATFSNADAAVTTAVMGSVSPMGRLAAVPSSPVVTPAAGTPKASPPTLAPGVGGGGVPAPTTPTPTDATTTGGGTISFPKFNAETNVAVAIDDSNASHTPVTTAAQTQLVAARTTPAPSAEVVSSVPQAANLAADVGQVPVKSSRRVEAKLLQTTAKEKLATVTEADGIGAAKRQASVTTHLSNPETASERVASSPRDVDTLAVAGLPGPRNPNGQAKDGGTMKAAAAVAAMPAPFVATAPAPAAEVSSAAPATGIVQVDKIESLLQAAQEATQKLQADGSGQVELRVRLKDVTDAVTVRVSLDADKQTQVSFQTASVELRAALEQGWNDLTAKGIAAPTGAAANTLDLPTFRPVTVGTSAEPTSSAPGHFQGSRRFSSPATTPKNNQPTRRWSGYA